MKIQTKISSIIFSVISVTGIVTIVTTALVSKQLIEAEVHNQLENLAISRASHVETLFVEHQDVVEILATETTIVEAVTRPNDTKLVTLLQQRIKSLVQVDEHISRIRVLDKNGELIASTHLHLGIDTAGNAEIFEHGKEGVYIQDIHTSKMTNTKVFSLSAPIRVTGELVGIVIANIEAENRLYPIMTNLTGLGNTGEIYLLNKEGYMITPSRFIEDTFLKLKVDSPKVREWLELSEKEPTSEPAKMDIYENYRGELVIGAHRMIKGMDWYLLAEIEVEEALMPVNRLVQFMLLFFIVLLGVSGILALFTAKNITRPIIKLHRRAEEIEKGHWDYQVTVDTQDEIGQFSRAFDSMTTQLKNIQDELQCHQDQLEIQISNRTAELSQRIQDIEQQKRGIQNLALDLETSQQRYESLVNSIDGVVWEADAKNLQFQFVSQQAQRLLGYPVSDWLNQPTFWVEHIHPNDRERATTHCINAAKNKPEHNFEYRMITADNQTIWLRNLVTVVVENDQAVKLCGVMFDITESKHLEIALQTLSDNLEAKVKKRTAQLQQEIAERQQIEIALRESEDKYRRIFETVAISIVMTDNKGKIIDINPYHINHIGKGEISKEVYLMHNILDHPSIIEAGLSDTYKQVLKGEEVAKTDVLFPTTAGGMIGYFNIRGASIFHQGKVMGAVFVHEDITERKLAEEELKRYRDNLELRVKERTAELLVANRRMGQEIDERDQAEKALRQSEEQFRKLFEEGPIGMVIVTPELRFIQANAAFCQMLGYTETELLQFNLTDISYPDDIIEDKELTQKALTGEIAFYQQEKRYLTKDGKSIWVNLAVSFFHNDEGEITHFLAKVEDITERKQAEEKLKQQETFLRNLINTAPSLIFVKNWDGKFVLVNQATAEIYGSTIEDLEGKTDADFNPNLPEVEQFIAADQKVLTSGQTQFIPEETVTGPNGQTRFFQTFKTPLLSDDGKAEQLLGVATDITARKQAEIALKQAKEEANSANNAKSEFLANMSHEIRTPMNAVIGFSEILASKITDHKQKSYLNSIQTAGKSLLTLINDILDLSKIEAGRLEIQYEPVHPPIIFTELQQIFSLKMAEKNLQWIMEIDDRLPPTLFLDETRLRQVLLNLIGNAVKFTDRGYIKLCTHQQTYANQNQIDFMMAVEDTGIGIPSDQQALIFDSFRQQEGQSTRQYGGTGLGLAITKRLVEMMNGQILVTSVPGKGSRFEIILRQVEIATTTQDAKPDNTFNLNNLTFEKAQVLVVDDIESNRLMIEESLSPVNLNVISAENGQEALLFAEEYHPALILMDLRMPEMDGYETTQHLKSNPNTADIPVIALTASVTLNEKAKTEAHGFDGYLAKPVNIAELLRTLSHYLKYTTKAGTDVPQVATEVDSTLNPENIANLPKLREQIDQKSMPLWEEANVMMEMDAVAKFAEQMIELGNEYNIEVFIRYGEALLDSSQTFEIDSIQKALEEFPALVKPLMLNP